MKGKSLRRLAEARDAILGAIEGLTEGEMTEEVVSGEWTVKDILGHVVSWGDELKSEALEIAKSNIPHFDYVISSENTYKQWNTQQAEKKKSLSLQELKADLEGDYEGYVELINELSDGELLKSGPLPWRDNKGTVGELIRVHCAHVKYHAKIVAEWRRGRGTSIRCPH